MKIIIDNPVLVYSPPVNENTSKWGVYAIPRMWRAPGGELVVRFNGEEDSGTAAQCVPNLYFVSNDDGESWHEDKFGEEHYDIKYLTGINPPFITLSNGDTIGVRYKDKLLPIKNIKPEKTFRQPCGSSVLEVYKYGDIPSECADIELFSKKTGKTQKINYDFPEREVLVNAKAFENNEFIELPRYVQANIFWSPYFTGITELSDGTLGAVTHGQNPNVSDRQCEDAYFIVSEDDGKTWRKRSTVADGSSMPLGCCGDGGEMSLTKSSNGNLICAMRTDMSTTDETLPCGTLVCVSEDNGFTWSEPSFAADSSVTPHVAALSDGIVLLIYGRPGVHFKISEDNGHTWSSSYPIIGKTLSEELASGNTYANAKYFDSCSYSNTFIEKLSDNTVLVLYNDLKYDDGDGKCHKAAFVRKITVTAE